MEGLIRNIYIIICVQNMKLVRYQCKWYLREQSAASLGPAGAVKQVASLPSGS